jgi:hypothetical protein
MNVTNKATYQGSDGCVIESVIPADIWTFEGAAIVVLHAVAGGTRVQAATLIKGQMFDWGKSRVILDNLFGGLRSHDIL